MARLSAEGLLIAALEAVPDAVAIVAESGRVELENGLMRELRATPSDDALCLRSGPSERPARDEVALRGGERRLTRHSMSIATSPKFPV